MISNSKIKNATSNYFWSHCAIVIFPSQMTKSFSQGLMICNLFPSCERKKEKNGNDQLEKMTGKIYKMNEFLFRQ